MLFFLAHLEKCCDCVGSNASVGIGYETFKIDITRRYTSRVLNGKGGEGSGSSELEDGFRRG